MVSPQPHVTARAAIQAAGLKHRDVARDLGIDASKLSKSLAGVRRFNSEELARLAMLTGVDEASLQPPRLPGASHSSEQSDPPASVHPNPRTSGAEFERQKQRIAAAAWPLFTARGYQGVKVADIAAATGMSTPAVLYYFSSKNDIFLATLTLCSQQAERRRAFVNDIADPAKRLLRFAEVQLDGSPEAQQEWTTWAQFWASSTAFDDAQQATAVAYDRWQQALRAIVTEGMTAGCFVAGDAEDMVQTVTAIIDGFGIRMVAGVISPAAARDAVTSYLKTWIRHTKGND